MRLEDYWGVGPKTSELLEAELGVEEAIDVIESADVRALTDAGLGRGRATRILRRVTGGDGMGVLATRDARTVYKELLAIATTYGVTQDAADRINLLTPLRSREAIEQRQRQIGTARESWDELNEFVQETVLTVYEEYDEADSSEHAAVTAALDLQEVGATDGAFAPIGDLDSEALREAANALGKRTDDGVRPGTDDKLDRLRETLESVESLESNALDLLESLRAGDVHGSEEFREAFIDEVAAETDASFGRIRAVTPDDATDAVDFVNESLRNLGEDVRERVDEREAAVAADVDAVIEAAQDDIDAAVEAVDDIAFYLSVAQFAEAFELARPTVVDDDTFAVVDARNLALAADDAETVQPITYAVGDHDVDATPTPPTGTEVSVLTGANSGGKTTLLETLCQVALLAQMGLPVPAVHATVTVSDAIVFHRRHASFNAGVLESTLRSIVPPLSSSGRTLMLVDEFEAITEPGSAASLLHGLVGLTVERDALGVFVTHLADDLQPLPEQARIDGIFAEGLDKNLELEVNYQPRFDTIGKSTPEFIVSRLVANASDNHERAGFQTLARAVGEETVQQTLEDAQSR